MGLRGTISRRGYGACLVAIAAAVALGAAAPASAYLCPIKPPARG